VGDGTLALAEALELHLLLELVETRGGSARELTLADDDLQLALETGDEDSLICMIPASTAATSDCSPAEPPYPRARSF